MTQVSDAEFLREAIEVINEPGKWCKRTVESRDGRHCMLGALDEVMKRYYGVRIYSDNLDTVNLKQYQRVRLMLQDAISEFDPEGKDDVARFNDRTRTKHADVMAAMEKAAIKLEEKA